MPDRRHADLGPDAPAELYICLPDRIIVIVNTNPQRKAG
jgi:hypothetical protein